MAPWNLALRFVLEMVALGGVGAGAWAITSGDWRWIAVVAAPVVVAVAWGVFNVPGDPSRSGRAPVPVPGLVRLIIEVDVFVIGAVGWVVAGSAALGLLLVLAALGHYLGSLPRVRWLLASRRVDGVTPG